MSQAGWVAVIGAVAAVCTTLAFAPQIAKTRRTGGADLSYGMLALYLGGVVLWLGYGVGLGAGNGWMHAKLALVVATLGYHHVCRRLLGGFEGLANRRTHRWYRAFNEVTVLLFALTVVLVVVKPF